VRQRLAVGLLVVACGLLGVAAGVGELSPVASGVRCALKLLGTSPAERQTEGDEPPLVVTPDSSGGMKGYVYTPAAYLDARQECSGTGPAAAMWESWQGSQHLDGIQTGAATARVHVYDGDPMGARTWKGPAGVDGVTFDELKVDIRFGTDIQQTAMAEPQGDGSVKVRYMALKYSPDAKAMIPYAGARVTVFQRCDGGDWTESARATANETGEFDASAEQGCDLRGIVDDSAEAWGLPVNLTAE
jgi:hypothetical protein